MESTRSAASSRLVTSTGHRSVPAYSDSMTSRTASMRAPFSGRKYLDAVQKVSVTYPGRPGTRFSRSTASATSSWSPGAAAGSVAT